MLFGVAGRQHALLTVLDGWASFGCHRFLTLAQQSREA
jgi:hypothetical protein